MYLGSTKFNLSWLRFTFMDTEMSSIQHGRSRTFVPGAFIFVPGAFISVPDTFISVSQCFPPHGWM
jgi:hypothetical protein